MKFLIAKKQTNKCWGCGEFINRGEDMVLLFRPIVNSTRKRIMCFHVTCHVDWYTEMFNTKYNDWKGSTGNNPPRPLVGRHPYYKRPDKKQKLNRLRSALCYHKKLDHAEMVGKITREINTLL